MNTYCCIHCNYKSYDYIIYKKHMWLEHPMNEYEIYWSKLYKSGKLFDGTYTLNYQDDPYY